MFKSFTGRFFAIYAFSIIVIFLLLFGVITEIISNRYIENRQLTMIEESRGIAEQYVRSTVLFEISQVGFDYQIEVLGRHINSRVLIVSSDQNVTHDSKAGDNDVDFIGMHLDMPLILDALGGSDTMATGNFNDHYSELHLLTAVPITYEDKVIGAVVMHSPYPDLEKEINYIYRLTLASLLVLLAVTFLSTYLFSRNISRTIEDISNGARKIANGDFTARVTLQGDSEINDLSKSMNYMAMELEKFEDMRKDFIANISHDFRSPLTSIKGFIQAILDGTIPVERQDKYLAIVLDETDRLTKLTNDILLLTKMENTTIQANRQNFDLHSVIRKIQLQFEQKSIDKNIDFTLLLDCPKRHVYGDMNQIQRVITNLVDNAIKFCAPGDAITIETSVLRNKVKVCVKDTGPGISEEDIKFIWDRFHKADRSRGKDKKGIGLGLSIVREIIKAHDEEINVYSQEGKGTMFVFTLALMEEKE